ncbi:ABC transporter substrate-binding protein [Paenibacillus sp. NPDC058071]|uniref:ABC transporter substrate-binding protein n=1 Tax=Paenibacillus sp. NPDC058071 TaxID=3346326 RepID=UPI0036DDB17A
MKSTWRNSLFILCLIMLVSVLAACGGEKKENAVSETPANNEQANVQGEATQKPSEEKRQFKDVIGDVLVPANPQRIVAPYVEDALVMLGVKPTMQWSYGELVQEYLQPELKDVPKLDFTDGVNMESLVAANPDLIVLYTKNLAEEGAYEQFNKIAPTYAFEDATVDWKGTLRILGDMLGKSDTAEQAIQNYDHKVEEAKEKLKPFVEGKTFAVIRVKQKEVLLMDGTYYSGPVLYSDLGLQPHKMVKELSWEFHKPLSLEVIPQLDADYIFLLVQGEAARDKANELIDSPLWKGLPAVQQGHVFEMDNTHWMASGAIANGKKIDDVLKAVVQ